MTFTYSVPLADWGRIAPVLILACMTLVVMLVDLLLPHAGEKSKDTGPANFVVLPILACLGVIGAIAAVIILLLMGDRQQAFNHMIGSDGGSLYAYLAILSASVIGLLLSPAYLKRIQLVHQGEYYALMLLATIGMLLMAAAMNFIIVFVGLEMLSLSLYILCGFVARRKSSQEAGMKYFLLSSFASAFLLYGMALTYGATGSTTFNTVALYLKQLAPNQVQASGMLLLAMGLMAVGFAFKISAVPFQAWTPDVYQGSPAPVTAFMSVGTKTAALVAFMRVFDFVLVPVQSSWMPVVWAIALLTIVGGNVMALVQSNVKRMLAYSSIAHGGYLLIGIVVGATNQVVGVASVLFYLLCYAFLNTGAFGVISLLERPDNSGLDEHDLRGLWYRYPVRAGFLAFFLLALAGFPPMAGFAAKYYLFYGALVGGHPELLIIGVVASMLGMYYYLRVIATMFMEGREPLVDERQVAPMPSSSSAVVTRRIAGTRTGEMAGTATAVAVKSAPTRISAEREKTEAIVEPEQSAGLTWMSWIGLYVAALGTLAMGTVLPFWLINVAQQAVPTMLK